MSNKKIVFISHITEEKELALELKELIENSFLGLLDVFVSSDENSIQMGQKWLNNITDSLKNCAIEIIVCSPKSIQRPWINFEAGAGWIRDIPVIPICHSGIEPSKLPMPLNLLQAAKANEVSSLQLIFPVLANAIGAKCPKIDFSDFITKVKNFEEQYTFWDTCNHIFMQINQFNPKIIETLSRNQPVALDLTETNRNIFLRFIDFLSSQNILGFEQSGGTKITENGTFYGSKLVPLERLKEIFNNKKFKFNTIS